MFELLAVQVQFDLRFALRGFTICEGFITLDSDEEKLHNKTLLTIIVQKDTFLLVVSIEYTKTKD